MMWWFSRKVIDVSAEANYDFLKACMYAIYNTRAVTSATGACGVRLDAKNNRKHILVIAIYTSGVYPVCVV